MSDFSSLMSFPLLHIRQCVANVLHMEALPLLKTSLKLLDSNQIALPSNVQSLSAFRNKIMAVRLNYMELYALCYSRAKR